MNEHILDDIKKTTIFNNDFKNELIKYFHLLSEDKKNIIIQALNAEKQIIINYLKSLKDEKLISFSEIKQNLYNLNKKILTENELKDKEKEDGDILSLLDNLE